MAGTGGASCGVDCNRAGDGSRNDRSDMDPAEPLRSNPDPGRPVSIPTAEPCEDTEAARLIVLFVCTSATDVAVVGWLCRAAPAAAVARLALETCFLKVRRAAAMASEFAVDPLRGCKDLNQ